VRICAALQQGHGLWHTRAFTSAVALIERFVCVLIDAFTLQLGTVYYVFPGASHNRFEHSLGVSWLSKLMVEHLKTQPGVEITPEEETCVKVAGAVHDLGHGPFSHVFDGLFIPTACPGSSWSHEDMSLSLFDLLLDDNGIEEFDDAGQRELVKRMVMGAKAHKGAGGGHGGSVGAGGAGLTLGFGGAGHHEGSSSSASSAAAASVFGPAGYMHDPHGSGSVLVPEEKPFLFEIVANGVSGIDTDKFDYLQRDSFNVGINVSFDYKRLLYGSRVMGDGHLGYHVKEAATVYDLFHTRHSLFRQIYVHRATKAVEFMITDALLEANAVWGGRIANAITDPREYMGLTDCVLHEIEYGKGQPGLAKAQQLLKSLRRRQLYRFVDEHLVPLELEATVRRRCGDLGSVCAWGGWPWGGADLATELGCRARPTEVGTIACRLARSQVVLS